MILELYNSFWMDGYYIIILAFVVFFQNTDAKLDEILECFEIFIAKYSIY